MVHLSKSILFKATFLIVLFVASFSQNKAKACHALALANITQQVITGTDVFVNAASTSPTCGCGAYWLDVEVRCMNEPFDGAPFDPTTWFGLNTYPYFQSATMLKPNCTLQNYPGVTIPFAGLCPGMTYQYRMRENNNGTAGPWCAAQTFVVPGVTQPLIAGASASNTTICAGDCVTLSGSVVQGCQLAATYTWDNGGGVGQNVNVCPLVTTTYTVTVVEQCSGFTDQASVTVTVLDPPIAGTAIITTPTTMCSGNPVNINLAGSQGTIQWQSAPNAGGPWTNMGGQTGTNLSIGSLTASTCFRAEVTGCAPLPAGTQQVYSNVICVTVDPAPIANFSFPPTCFGDPVNFTDLSNVNGGTAITQWNWNFGDGNTSTAQNPSHTYAGVGPYNVTLTVTNATGCADVVVIPVNILPQLVPVIDPVGNQCLTGNSFNFNGGNSTPAASITSYNWNFGDATTGTGVSPSHTYAAPGTYTVTLTITDGTCTESITANVTVNPMPTVVVTGTNMSCNGVCNGSALATPAGSAGYTYSWTNTANTSANPTGLCANTYTVTVTDINGCQVTGSYTVTEPPVINSSITGTNVTCAGAADGSATVTASGGTPALTYNWTPAPGGGQGTANATGLAGGTAYTVTITDGNGCTATETFTPVEPAVITSSIVGTNISCNGAADGTATVTAGGGTPALTYNWAPVPGGGQGTANVTGLGPVTYTVTITDGNGCTATESFTPTENPPLTVTASGTNLDCNGICIGTVAAAAAGGDGAYTYAWTNGAGTNATANSLCANTYTVTVTDGNGCTATDSYTVTEPTPLTVAMSGNPASCNGVCDGDATATPAGGTAGYTFQWDAGGNLGTNGTETALCAGTAGVTVTDANGCTVTDNFVITEPTALTASSSATPANCGVNDGTASVTAGGGAGGYTYVWAPAPGAGQGTANASSMAGGAYTVTITDANGCTLVENVNVPNNSAPAGSEVIASHVDVLCFGNATGVAEVTQTGGTPGFTYLWAPAPGAGQGTSTGSGLSAGNYSVTITDAGGCADVVNITITEPPLLNSAITGQTDPLCATVCDGTADVTVSGGTPGYTYAWTSGGTAANETGMCAGASSVTVTDANGCTTVANLVLTDPPVLTAAVVGTDATCNGVCDGAVDLTVGGGTGAYSYAWDNAATSEDISALCAGAYNVTVTDANGCTAIANYTVTEPTVLTVTTTPTDATCGNPNGSATANGAGGTGAITYEWFSDAGLTNSIGTGNAINSLLAGTYYVEVTDANGCTASAPVTIGNTGGPTVSITIDQNATCNGVCDGAATAVIVGGTAGFTYLWNNGETTAQAIALCDGPIDVTITDANGCVASNTETITQPVAMTLTIAGTDANCNGACDGSADATVAGGTAPYSYLWQHGPTSEDLNGVLCAGTFTLDATDANGCTVQAAVVIAQPTVITSSITGTDVSCNGAADGTATVTAAGGTGALTYVWAPAPTAGQGTNAATGLTGGTAYTVTVTDANGCFTTETFTPAEPTLLTINGTTVNSNCGQADGSADATSTGGTGAVTFEWFSDAALTASLGTGSNLSNIAAGTYYVEVTDANGCTASTSVNVVDNSAGTLSETHTNALCNGSFDGTIDLTVTGGAAPFTYAWVGPNAFTSATQDITGLEAGTYDVTVSDVNGCVMTLSVVITEPTLVTVAATGVDALCFGSADGSVDATGAGGTGAITYEWFDNAALTSSVGTGTPLTGLTAGTYYVEATDANGCTATSSVTISEPALIVPVLAAVDANCGQSDGSVSVTSTSGGSGTYVSETWVDGASNPVANPNTVPGGSYTVTVTDDNGCTGTATIGVNDLSGPTVTVVASTDASCALVCDGTASVNATGGVGPYTYNWTPNPTTGQGTPAISDLCAGVYNVTVTDANGCVDNIGVTITEPPVLDVIITASSDATINGASDGTADAAASGGTPAYTYEWFNGCPPGATTGQTGTSATGLAAGDYSVIATDAKGCIDTACVTINEPGGILVPVVTTDASCFGVCDGSATVTASGGVGGFTYQWYDAVTTNPLPGQTGTTASNLCAGDYYVIVTDANGGFAQSNNVTINEPTIITATTSVVSNYNGQDVSCAGACDASVNVVAAGGTPGYLYQWNDPAASTTTTVNGLCAGNYDVDVTDFNGCVQTFNVVVTEPTPLANVLTSVDNSCFASCDGSATATPSGGTAPYTYQWDDPALSTTATASNLCAGTYNVIITDANGCTFNDQIIITEPTELILAQSTVGSNCGQTDGSASVTVTQGDPTYSYLWDVAAGSQTTATASNLGFGCYDVTVTDGNGCTAVETVCVQDLGSPTITPLTITDVTCNGACDGFAQVQVTGGTPGYNYQWFDVNMVPVSGISATPSLGNLCAGDYTAQMTDASGCVATAAITINEPTALNAVISNTTDVTCFGDCDGATTVLASGGTPGYTYQWNDPAGQTTTTASNLCPGAYNVTVTDINGCTFNINSTIAEPLQILLTSSDVDAFCNTPSGSATVNITQGGVGNISYSWNPTGQATQTATNLTPGTYTVTVTDQDGCSAQVNATVGNIPPGIATITNVTNVSCNGGADGEATVSMAGGTPAFTYEWFLSNGATIGQTTQTATGLSIGQYFAVVTDANGCTSNSDTITITEPTALAFTMAVDSVDCASNCDGTATITMSGGVGPYTYQWNNALMETTPTAQGLCSGTYDVVVTDNNGCILNASAAVLEPNPMVLDSNVVNANCQQADGLGCVIVSGGTLPYSYLWPSGTTNSCDINLAANTYIVDVTDGNGCMQQIPVEISDLSGPSAAIIASTNVSCFGGNDGSATVDMVGGSGNIFTAQWDANANNQTTPSASNLSAGLYSVTITDDLGCSASTNVTITEPPLIQYSISSTDPVCFGYCDGQAWVTVIGGTPPYTYSWMDNAGNNVGTTDTAFSLCSGTYNLTITDANGCTDFGNVTLTDPIQVSGITTFTNVTCNGFCDGTATANGIQGIAPFTYQWDAAAGNQTTPTASNLCPGNYVCTITDADGCFTTVNATITEPTQVAASITVFGNVSCSGACDGFAQVDPSGGTPGYTYSWDNNAGNAQTATNLCPNTYTATVTDFNGCQITANVNIIEPNPLSLTSNKTNVSCFGACDGTATINLAGGTGPFTYQWDDPAFSTTAAVNNLCAGQWTCTINDANGCVITETVNITQPNFLGLTAVLTDANCGQANGSLCVSVVGGVAPFTYQWSDANTTTSACLNNVTAGCYTMTIVDANGCVFDSLLCINDILGPDVLGVNSQNVTCFGDQDGYVEFTVTGGTGISVVELFDASNTSISNGQTLTNNLNGGCYTLIATDAAGCIGTDVICITEPNQINSAVTSSTDVSCFLGCDGEATVSVSGGLPSVLTGYTYSWNGGAAPTSATNTGLCAGTYTVVVSDSNNCQTQSTIVITEPTQLTLTSSNIVDVSCNGLCDGTGTITASGATPPYIYTWTPAVSSGAIASNLCAGNFDLIVTDGLGCTENSNLVINEPAALTLTISSVNSTCTQCNGEATVVPAGGTAPYTFQWMNGGNNPSSATNTGLCPGGHTVEVTDAQGCVTIIAVTVIDEPAPTISGFNITKPLCNGLSNGSAEVLHAGGTGQITYLWDAAAFNQNSNPAVALQAGTYCVTITDANGCQATQCATVTEPAPLLPVPDIDATICYGDSSQLWASGQGGTNDFGYTINWLSPGLSGSGPIMVSPLVTTNYCFNVTDDNGCLSPTGCILITVLPPLDLTLTPSTFICSGDGIDLVAHAADGNGGPYNFNWVDDQGNVLAATQNGDSSFINVNPPVATWYYVTLSDGCSLDVIDSTLISVNPIPTASISAVDSAGCVPFTAQFIANSDIGVTYEFDFECDGIIDYSGPNSNPTFTYQTPGAYNVCMTVISADGCDTSISVNQMIEVYPLPVAEFSLNPPLTTALNPTITFTNLSSGALTYDWDFGDGNSISGIDTIIPTGTNGGMTIGTFKDPLHTYADTGYFTITLTVTNEFGCTDQISYQVHIEGDYILFAPSGFTPNGDGTNDVFLPVGIGITQDNYAMYIFDRWGQIIFESHTPDIGWDGVDPRNGRVAKTDVYVWLIRADDHKGEPHEYIGHVTLLK